MNPALDTEQQIGQSAESVFKWLLDELRLATQTSERQCSHIASRLLQEVARICTESQRIQTSGDVPAWMLTLSKHRLQQCLRYYRLGSRQGRVELHSNLSAMIYRYVTPSQSQASYRARLSLIEDFLQSFYMESLNALRREAQLLPTYQPRSLLELAEYMAFTERYAKRRIPLPGRRSQQLVILRAQTFSQQQPSETLVDMELAAEGVSGELESSWNAVSLQRVREQMVLQEPDVPEDSLRHAVVQELIAYLEERKQDDCANYFALRLQDLPTAEIEAILGITPRQRDYLQQRFKYHLIRFALSHRWELVHQWLEADLERNLGLTPGQWDEFQAQLNETQLQLLELKQAKVADAAIAQQLGCTVNQLQKKWFKLLEQAWEIRNRTLSGATGLKDE